VFLEGRESVIGCRRDVYVGVVVDCVECVIICFSISGFLSERDKIRLEERKRGERDVLLWSGV
jgi:hypothetical protein